METSEHVNEIAAALAAFQGECPDIPRNKTVKIPTKGKTIEFAYSPWWNTLKIIRPILAKHGLCLIQGHAGGHLETRIIHKSGQWISDTYPFPQTKFSDMKAEGSELTYRKRYQGNAMLGIEGDDDVDAQGLDNRPKTPTTITPEQVRRYYTIAGQFGWSREEIHDEIAKRLGGITSVNDIQPSAYDAACEALERGGPASYRRWEWTAKRAGMDQEQIQTLYRQCVDIDIPWDSLEAIDKRALYEEIKNFTSRDKTPPFPPEGPSIEDAPSAKITSV